MRILTSLLICFIALNAFSQLRPENGVKESEPRMIALKNAKVYITPDRILNNATILIDGDRVAEVGTFVIIPEEAVVIDCKDKVILPAFIETYTNLGLPKPESSGYNPRPQLESLKKGAYYWNETIHPEVHAANLFNADLKAEEELLKMGFGTVVTHVQDGIMRGTGALVSLGEHNASEKIIKTHVAQFLSFEKGVSKQSYPSSQMGAIALLRQVFYDEKWYAQSKKKEVDLSLEELTRFDSLPFVFSSRDKWEIFRAKKIADEFGKQFSYIGSGNEYSALHELGTIKDHVVLPLDFPEPFDVRDPYIARQIPLSDLKHWELAPSNPHILKTKGVPFCFTTDGVKNAETFWKNVRKTIERGLSPEDALAALTVEPAKLLKVEQQLGTLEKGKLASFCIYSSNPFEGEATLHEVWTLGKQRVLKPIPLHDITGTYNVNLKGYMYPLEISGSGDKLQAKIKGLKTGKDERTGTVSKDTVSPKVFINLLGDDLTLQFTMNDDHFSGNLSLHAKVRSKFGVFEGDALLPDGSLVQWSAIRNGSVDSKKQVTGNSIDTLICDRLWFPNMAYGFDIKPSSETIVFRDATVWTNEKEGILRSATVIVQDGKIAFVGSGTYGIPAGARVIDAKGKHVTSGIIDEHSHIAISRGVNEGGQAVSAEVRIGDVINPDDINIYRQLAGGVTAAQLLHGSANPIGGQSALIKLKWGATPDEMLIKNAPKFIKCALGENVKQANWGENNSVRFPQTRMGVEQVFYDGFERALAYEKEWNAFRNDKKGSLTEPRRDLELDALLEILKSERFISCHSYVQSEINMLMKVADSMGFKVNTFTHILEGYKVADKMREHGAGGSTFSDWWAYKYEVKDAIPQNAKMMADQGVVVSINSDDAEMGRRLNQEAAKSVKYGGMSEEEAWKMVTLNPAKLLHLDDRMGSIRVGKDADVVLWTDNPLSISAKVELTVVDGTVMFDSKRDYVMRVSNQEEKARIITKMLESNEKGESSREFVKKKSKRYHCDTLGEEGTEGENHH